MSTAPARATITLPPDVLRQVDDAARVESRNRSQQITHVLRHWFAAGESRVAVLERIAAEQLAKGSLPSPATAAAAAAAHLAEHARLSGLNTSNEVNDV